MTESLKVSIFSLCFQRKQTLFKEEGDIFNSLKSSTKIEEDKFSWNEVKGKSEPLSFQEFGDEALHRLQRQFLNTPDTKDTVLTRMNIIQMIKDLKELGLK